MTEPLNGLRFDIYERVHLPEDVAAIEELEEIELVPHMQAQTQEDHVLLRGHLLLSGVYRSKEQEGGVSQLEHWIPVEISLPYNRVQRVEDLAVDIDNFDVDLLSTRTLNVTGVLALRGLQADSAQVPVWRDDSFTVVHQAAEDRAEAEDEQQSALREVPTQEAAAEHRVADDEDAAEPDFDQTAELSWDADTYARAAEEETDFQTARETGWGTVDPGERREPATGWGDLSEREPGAGMEWGQLPESKPEPGIEWGPLSERKPEPWFEAAPVYSPKPWADLPPSYRQPEPEAASPASAPPAEERPEMTVALGAKPPETIARIATGVGLLSQLGDKGAAREAELQAIRSAQAEQEAESKAANAKASTGDELEWTKLFLGQETDAQPFRRVRMCIVQREETLDSIAARYNVQPREIQLRNRLSDPYLSEGQVLYIP